MSKWIWLGAKTPQDDERVLVCGKCGGISIARYVAETKEFWCNSKHMVIKAKYWMPLPAPVGGKAK